jgi:hypothetical protein
MSAIPRLKPAVPACMDARISVHRLLGLQRATRT